MSTTHKLVLMLVMSSTVNDTTKMSVRIANVSMPRENDNDCEKAVDDLLLSSELFG